MPEPTAPRQQADQKQGRDADTNFDQREGAELRHGDAHEEKRGAPDDAEDQQLETIAIGHGVVQKRNPPAQTGGLEAVV